MRTYLLIERVDWWSETYANLYQCYRAERMVLPAPTHAKRKWQRVLRIAAKQAWLIWPTLWALLRSPEPVLLICTTAHYATLVSERIARWLGRRPRVYLVNFYLHSLGNRRLVRSILARLLNTQVGILVQSPNEVDYYRSLAPRATIDYYPLGLGKAEEPAAPCASSSYIFAGGFTNRDYDTLLRVARRLGDQRFLIVRSAANHLAEAVSPNVEILSDIPEDRFRELLCSSRFVVLPLRDNVGSSGQMVALAAMQMGKLVIYADYPVVSQYFSDGHTGLAYRPRDEQDLQAKIEAAARDDGLVRRVGGQARDEWQRRFVRERYEQALMEGVERFVAATEEP